MMELDNIPVLLCSGAGQLTQKPTHPQKKWSTHPNFWITHPNFKSTHPSFLDDSPNYYFHIIRQKSHFCHSIGIDIHKYSNINIDFSASFIITAILYFLKLEERMRTCLGAQSA